MVVPAGRGAGGGLGPCRAACAALPRGCRGCPGARGELSPALDVEDRSQTGPRSLPMEVRGGRAARSQPVTRASLLIYLMHRVLQALTPLFCMLTASKSRAQRQMSLSRSKYHKYILQLCRRCRGLVPPDPQRGTVTFLPCASMLPWTEPKSPGLFFFLPLPPYRFTA